jgi:hypothetical protein
MRFLNISTKRYSIKKACIRNYNESYNAILVPPTARLILSSICETRNQRYQQYIKQVWDE